MDLLASLTRLYFGKFPVERGKWRLWTWLRPYLRGRGFPRGIYPVAGRFRMELDPEEYIHAFIYYWGEWEPDESWLVRTLLRPGDRFVDVGANVGYFSLLAATVVGERGLVVAVEPVPTTAEQLLRNIEINGFTQIRTVRCAASDRPGQIGIGRPVSGSGQSSIRLDGPGVTRWQVPAERLDALLADLLPVRLVKMDVEGAECQALEGLSGVLRRPDAPMVLCEVTDPFLRDLGSSAAELCDLMQGWGFTRVYDIHGRRLERIDPVRDLAGSFQTNVLFAKEDVCL